RAIVRDLSAQPVRRREPTLRSNDAGPAADGPRLRRVDRPAAGVGPGPRGLAGGAVDDDELAGAPARHVPPRRGRADPRALLAGGRSGPPARSGAGERALAALRPTAARHLVRGIPRRAGQRGLPR